ncbi:hypothetical protein HNQ35_001096 [Cerasibacillus quisquiliarum]|uniref:YlxR domain-containing protein n=1 Tax=Cerasibacillus quisquiliarum TaxID=227865 RepID=A0A511UV36_9BACI|nr:YlxR family protein [Cerasibacillus quisquiliarum]MBB5145895.1 hypothetical protein [Cerasibacillus quisquiliarum]GEN30466.1 hypothetical protein CQU01_07040 [Cerasibacillus quisquiliarum]
MGKKRRIPLRKCVVTSEMKPKKDMIRIVRDKEGNVSVDPTGKKSGRGAYVTRDLDVIEQAEKTGVLKRHLNTDIDQHIYDELRKFVDTNA